MDDIRIYQNFTKRLFAALGAFVFGLACGVILWKIGAAGAMAIFMWVGVVFFGGGALCLLIDAIRNRLKGIAQVVIHSDSVDYYIAAKRTYHTFHFVDVERFRQVVSCDNNFVAVDFTADAASRIVGEKTALQLKLSKMNKLLVGSDDAICADNLSMKVDELVNVLNERLKKYSRKENKSQFS